MCLLVAKGVKHAKNRRIILMKTHTQIQHVRELFYADVSSTCLQKCELLHIFRDHGEHVLWIKDDRFPKIVLLDQPSLAKRKAGRPRSGCEDVVKKDLRETGASWEGAKREALNGSGWRSVYS